MPRVDIWIRKEAWGEWKAIKNKPEWLHRHLAKQGQPVYPLDDPHPGQLHSLSNSFKGIETFDTHVLSEDNMEPKITPPEETA